MDDAHAKRLRVMVWFRAPDSLHEMGVVEEDHFERLLDLEVDMICTNKPDVLLALVRKRATATATVANGAGTVVDGQ